MLCGKPRAAWRRCHYQIIAVVLATRRFIVATDDAAEVCHADGFAAQSNHRGVA